MRFSPFFDIYLHFISIFFKFLYNIKVANFGFLVRLATFFLIIIYIIRKKGENRIIKTIIICEKEKMKEEKKEIGRAHV